VSSIPIDKEDPPIAALPAASAVGARVERWLPLALLWLTGLALLVFLLLPIGAMLIRAFQTPQGEWAGVAQLQQYLATPALGRSVWNSLWISSAVAAIAVPAAFFFAYALNRSCMPFKNGFRLIALVPLLAPSLLSAISMIQWFGNQGVLKPLMGGMQIYGAPGIILSQVYNTFPHALMILTTALALSDSRLYEAAESLGASRLRRFLTVTLPGCKYGLISAVTVVFTYVIADFGAPKVIGGNINVLALDVFKQVVGQHNFSMGAVVGILLLIPSVLAFAVDLTVRRRLRAQLSARSVPYSPRPRRGFDAAMTAYCVIVCAFLLAVIGMAFYTSVIRLWPYNLELTLRHYHFALVQGDMAGAYRNSLVMASFTAALGATVAFGAAYLIEKTRGSATLRSSLHLLAMMSMAVPGLVLGLGYIMFFNHPSNPLNFLYGSMAILVVSTVVHYYTSSHLTAVTALKQLDAEFEAVSASLKVPFWRTFRRVTLPVCLPAVLDIARYYFVVAMTTLSAVVFLYSPDTVLAAIAILSLDEAGDVGPAAALGCLIVATSLAVCMVYGLLTRVLLTRTQAWRNLGARS
jgi:iron(III) transport system permease protein